MASRKKGGVIGFDPLAWMKDDSPQASAISRPTDDSGRQSTVVGHPSPTTSAPTTTTDDPRPATGDAPSAVQLGDTLTIEQVAAMHAELGRHLHAKTVVLEVGHLRRIDAAGLQLLTAFVRAARGRGVTIDWCAPTAALRDGARRLGLDGALDLD